ncbi:amidohydrolase family protein [Microlunatus sp. GCM10028923]|uniref:amidohydrolase family protein n=1 Tax=Microlunatus sp. GCM10028923 TaxID=3273400 RepID=UPI0036153737
MDYRTDGASFALTNVIVFDGEQLTDADTVVVRDGLIAGVGAALTVPEDLPKLDGQGRLLLPGLIDAHVHSATWFANASLRFGSTTLLEMNGLPSPDEAAAREDVARDDAADVWTAGFMITVPGGHGTQWGGDPPVLESGTDIDGFIDERLGEGSDFIKLVIEELEETFPTLTPRQVKAVVRAAHNKKRLAMAHIGTWDDAAVAIDAGIDALVHAPRNAPINDRVVSRLAAQSVPVVPTLTLYAAASGQHDSSTFLDHPQTGPYLDQDQKAAARRTSAGSLWPTWFDDAVAGVTALYEAGVPILAGTDFANAGTIPGVSLLHEIKLLQQAGLSDHDALAAATSRGADLLGLTDRGRIGPGKRADLILMNVTSIKEVIGSYDIAAIWRNGHFVDRQPVDRAPSSPHS